MNKVKNPGGLKLFRTFLGGMLFGGLLMFILLLPSTLKQVSQNTMKVDIVWPKTYILNHKTKLSLAK